MDAAPIRSDDRREARELADIWSSQSRRHVSLGAACACGIGGVTLQLLAYEQDIVDYIVADAEKQGRADVLAFLDRHARQDEDSGWRVALLLDALGNETDSGDPGVRRFVLERLGRTLRSFAQMHG